LRMLRQRSPPLPESHSSTIFRCGIREAPIPPPSAQTVPDLKAAMSWVSWGDGAMWIIWYIGMMASLRAMGLAPSLVPVKIDEDRKPFGDM